MGVFAYCNEQKINIPKKIKVVGFSNWYISQVITPKLSTVEQPSHEMGKLAFDLSLEEMTYRKEGEDFKTKTIKLDTQVIIREYSLDFY